MPSSDVQAKRLTATGSAGVGPARIRQIQVLSTTGSPRLTITDASGGSTVLDLDFKASDSHSVNIPGDWVRVSDIYISVFTAITAVTVFYA